MIWRAKSWLRGTVVKRIVREVWAMPMSRSTIVCLPLPQKTSSYRWISAGAAL